MNQNTALWAGGFEEKMHPSLKKISDSLYHDMMLADADLRASAVYARALAKCGVLKHEEGQTLSQTLLKMREELRANTLVFQHAEDIHTAIEAEVTKRTGELGERLHTGRSRNDQVSTAFRLTLAEQCDLLLKALHTLQSVIVQRAQQEIETLIPAYTHIQRAQPVRLAHVLMGYFWPLQRDVERLIQARARILTLPLGSGAVSGHPFGIDRTFIAQELGFVAITENSIDAVGDRDFACEAVFVMAMIGLHLSRIAEEFVLWSTTEFSYIQWPDALASGSSLMPNKKNPDLVELVRGRAAAPIGDLITLLTLIKGLAPSYQRDLQEDKPPVWRACTQVLDSVVAMTAAFQGIQFKRDTMHAALSDDILATEAADVLVTRGVPFRQAYKAVAQTAAQARKMQCSIKEVAHQNEWPLPTPLTQQDLIQLHVQGAVERRTAPGGTSQSAILEQIKNAQHILAGSSL